jgi:glutaredoxin
MYHQIHKKNNKTLTDILKESFRVANSSSKFVIFTKKGCPYCARSIQLAEKISENPIIVEINPATEPKLPDKLFENIPCRTYPQIFHFSDGKHIGDNQKFQQKYAHKR